MSVKQAMGPWKAARNKAFWQVVTPREDETIEQASTHSISVAYAWGDTEEQSEAHARLIAAAPDLLEALANIVDWIKQGDFAPEFLGAAELAILKATGGQQ